MTSDQATVGAFIVAALALLFGVAKWVWPKLASFFGSVNTTFETINGKPARHDRSGREVEPASPSIAAQIADLKSVVSDQAQQNKRITAVEAIAAEHGRRLDRIEDGAHFERIVTKVESATAWKAMEAIASQEDRDTEL